MIAHFAAHLAHTTARQRFLAMYGEMSIFKRMSMELCLLMSHLQLATSFVHLFAQSTSTTNLHHMDYMTAMLLTSRLTPLTCATDVAGFSNGFQMPKL